MKCSESFQRGGECRISYGSLFLAYQFLKFPVVQSRIRKAHTPPTSAAATKPIRSIGHSISNLGLNSMSNREPAKRFPRGPRTKFDEKTASDTQIAVKGRIGRITARMRRTTGMEIESDKNMMNRAR